MNIENSFNSACHVLAVICLLLVIWSTVLAVRPSPGLVRTSLSGTWQVNTRLSRNGQSDLPGKLQSAGRFVDIDATDDWTRAEADARTTELLHATESLEIIFHGRQLTINSTGATDVVFTRTMFFDGRTTSGRLLRARIVDDSMVIESSINRMSIRESYRIDPITSQLLATFTIRSPKWNRPLIVERVYDRLLTSARRRVNSTVQ